MTTIDDHLTPDDARVALASFPGRFRAVFAGLDDDRHDPDELARRYGRGGVSAAEHLATADGVVSLLADALGPAGRTGTPLHPALAVLDTTTWDDPGAPVDALLDQLDASCSTAAAAVQATSTEQWGEPLQIADVDAAPDRLHVLRMAVAVIAERRRAAEQVLAEVR